MHEPFYPLVSNLVHNVVGMGAGFIPRTCRALDRLVPYHAVTQNYSLQRAALEVDIALTQYTTGDAIVSGVSRTAH